MNIVTEYFLKHWVAYDDDAGKRVLGRGETEEEAIADLLFAGCTCDGETECESCKNMREEQR